MRVPTSTRQGRYHRVALPGNGYREREILVNQRKGQSMLKAGAQAPDFKLKSHDGAEVSLDQYRGKWVVLHTFPVAFTGG